VAAQRYDTIGLGYVEFRRPEPRIAARLSHAVGDAQLIVNVGAGPGSYELDGRALVAVEPSEVMVQQRPQGSAPAVRATAEHLPFPDGAFDVATAIMTVHHWRDLEAGLAEMRRVSARQVVLTFDPAMHDALWVFTEYVPASLGFAYEAPLERVMAAMGATRTEVVPVPADCADGFALAYWRRPEAYLSAAVRASISAFARLSDDDVGPGMARLEADLASGAWHERHADLLQLEELDLGLRIVIAGPA
jgi:SAM-dependent methyltransferase